MFDGVICGSAATEYAESAPAEIQQRAQMKRRPRRWAANAATVLPADAPPMRDTRELALDDLLIEGIMRVSWSGLNRLRSLSVAHLEDSDQHPLSMASLLAYLRFRVRYPDLSEGGLVLTSDGNLRSVWLMRDGGRVGLEFLPNQRVKYVALKRRVGDEFAVSSGSDLPARVYGMITSFGALSDMGE